MSEKNQFDQPVGKSLADWKHLEKPNNNVLQGEYALLEPINIETHAAPLLQSLAINNQGATWTYLPYGPFTALADFERWLNSTTADTKIKLYAIRNVHTQQIVGICGYLNITPEHGVIEIGHLHFSTLLQKTRAATETIYLLLKKVFDEMHYRRSEWKCNSLNQASRNAALRFGFTFEGIFRQHLVHKNRNRDTAWFSMLDSEWPEIKNKFEHWLHPHNFNQDGKQLRSLQEC